MSRPHSHRNRLAQGEANTLAALESWSIEELLKTKAEMKRKLRKFDERFEEKHGRKVGSLTRFFHAFPLRCHPPAVVLIF